MISDITAEIASAIARVEPAWDAADFDPPRWGFALHPDVVERCAVCGGWGTLIADTSCVHPTAHRQSMEILAVTTLGGETVPLVRAMVDDMLAAGLWLAGHTPVTIRAAAAQAGSSPMASADLVLLVAPTLNASDGEAAPLYARVNPGLLRRPLIFLAQTKPRCLPR